MKTDWSISELVTLTEAARLLRRAHRPRSPQTLYDRIRRGTLYGVRLGRDWYIPRREVKRLARQPYHPQGGRPSYKSPAARKQARGKYFDFPEPEEIKHLAQLPVAKRGRAALAAQATLRGLSRGRLRRQFPRLSPKQITEKLWEEWNRHG